MNTFDKILFGILFATVIGVSAVLFSRDSVPTYTPNTPASVVRDAVEHNERFNYENAPVVPTCSINRLDVNEALCVVTFTHEDGSVSTYVLTAKRSEG